jgi:hypothetical protein
VKIFYCWREKGFATVIKFLLLLLLLVFLRILTITNVEEFFQQRDSKAALHEIIYWKFPSSERNEKEANKIERNIFEDSRVDFKGVSHESIKKLKTFQQLSFTNNSLFAWKMLAIIIISRWIFSHASASYLNFFSTHFYKLLEGKNMMKKKKCTEVWKSFLFFT